jgi:hypothetical protein
VSFAAAKATRFKVVYRGTDKKQHVAGMFGSRREAEKAYGDAKARVRLGVDPRALKPAALSVADTRHGITLASFAYAWLPSHRLGAHARETYRAILDCKILPELGNEALADIDVPRVKAMLRAMEDAGASNAYISKVKTVLGALPGRGR